MNKRYLFFIQFCILSIAGMSMLQGMNAAAPGLSKDKIKSVILRAIDGNPAPSEKTPSLNVLKKRSIGAHDIKCNDMSCEDDEFVDDRCNDHDSDDTHVSVIGGGDDVVIGSIHAPKNLTVTGNERIGGTLMVGTIDERLSRPGCRYIVGAIPFNPATQQFIVRFKDKSRLPSDPVAHGAYIELDFITTGSKNIAPVNCSPISSAVAHIGCRFSGLYINPKMTGADLAVNANGTAIGPNNVAIQCDSSSTDIKITVTARVETLTKDIAFGFVPVRQPADNALEAGGFLFYGKGGLTHSAYDIKSGMLAYRIVSDNVFSVGVGGLNDNYSQEDILSSLSDCELLALYKALHDWFGIDVIDNCKAIEFLQKNKHRLGGLLRSLKTN